MKVSHIEHLGIAVKSLDEAIPYWENVLGLKCYAIEEVADQKVRTAFFMLGQTKIELLEPTSEESTIAKFIENRGIGIHHMALACENIEEQLADAEAKGIRLIDKTHSPMQAQKSKSNNHFPCHKQNPVRRSCPQPRRADEIWALQQI